ncbi:MAG: LysM peptidoglycan-binding domain-containing protein [Bacteroidales bacterium]|nr:LysM peptidoglycan-binding domain-containing protein [Bacteroidales bacterium]
MNLLRVFLMIPIAVCFIRIVDAQVSVTVSEKKTVIDGKTYYLHTVRQGETLYSISKAYHVRQEDIAANNPGSAGSIRAGQELKIPDLSGNVPEPSPPEPSQLIAHVAEKGQTVYSLMQTYGVTREELYRHNPVLRQSPLQAGQVVNIPRKDQPQSASAPDYQIYEVKKRETLFSIAAQRRIDVNRILELNPEIDPGDRKIKTGQQIKLPVAVRGALPATAAASLPADTLSAAVADSVACLPTTRKTFRIAMLLPLFLSDNFSVAPRDTTVAVDKLGRMREKNGAYRISSRSDNALEFYQGALLAIDSLQQCGLSAKVHLFDTMRDTLKIDEILKDPVMKDMDLIIGPFYTDMIDRVARFAAENRIFYVSPTATNIESLKANPYLLQINAGEINSVTPMVNFIAGQDSVHVVIIGNRTETDQTLFHAYLNRLKAVAPDLPVTALQLKTDSLVAPPKYLQSGKKNIVIVTAINEAFINIIAAQLNAATHDYSINLYGLALWTKFINLDMEYLHQLEFRFTSAYHIDHTRKDVARFLQQYRKYYHSEPSMFNKQGGYYLSLFQHAFLGYDAMFFLGSAMRQYGKEFGHCISQFRLPTLQSDFHFTKVHPSGGYMNTNLNIYRYTRSYTVVRENR